MEVRLDGKVIIITGAARGIGAAIAHHAAESGADGLFLTDRDPIRGGIDAAATHQADLEDAEAAPGIVDAALQRFGRIDALVNAAGLTTRASFLDASVERWDRLMAVNVRAPFFLMSGVIQHLTGTKRQGTIVNIQSMNAHCGAPDLAIYASTKGALQTMTKNAANAHLRDRIRVNGINLGWVDTETERALHEETLGKGPGWLAAEAAKAPLGRLISVDEAARTAVYLLSDVSAPMTGLALDLEQSVTGAPG